jgi:hypothetical protein
MTTKVLTVILTLSVLGVMLAGCGRNPCRELSNQVCELAPGTDACESASRLTATDECAGYLNDVARYVELKNLKTTEPARQPPSPAPVPEAPAPEAPTDDAAGTEAPDTAPAIVPPPAA